MLPASSLNLRALRLAFACVLLPLASGCSAAQPEPAKPELGLMGTIPIYWGEAGEFGDLLNGKGSAHWARARLEGSFTLQPLDTLSAENLAGLDFLLLAQPRALSPAENVALDDWVRQGGRLLLFADPMMTGGSRYAVGDRRRPQDVVLLSPILRHWGLEMEFDVERPEGVELLEAGQVPIPVNRPGSFTVSPGEGACTLSAKTVLARCRIGQGEVTVLADAAVLDLYRPAAAAPAALDWLVGQGLAKSGEIAGRAS